jgi:arthrofactin-type cyclic lipopeptide synthetase B
MISSVLAAAEVTAPPEHPTLRVLQTGGERVVKLPATVPCPLFNVYGPTECAIVCTAGRVGPDEGLHIGRPLPRAITYVLDEWLRPVPPGVPGELYIGGAGVGAGYVGRPGLTAARFCPDPFAGGGARMYRTGDRVRWRADGAIEFIGRFDNQVKLRGHRIELGEIETAVAACDGVGECAVLVRPGGAGGDRLVAWWVPSGPVAEAALREQVAALLPSYMVPAVFVAMDVMPRTRNGKLDTAALPEPAEALARPAAASAVPGRAEAQDVVADAWCEVLGMAEVSDDDDFFALGGHSMLAARAVTLVGERLGRRISVVELFEHPTLGEFAAAIGEET